MARENTVKRFVAGGTYHLYNRGNNKAEIFFDEKDYWVFRRYIKRSVNDMDGKIELIAFALLPNHYHLLVRQLDERSISTFMRKLCCSYGRYIAKKYFRSGNLYGSIYRAILLDETSISRVLNYVLLNPLNAGYPEWKHVGQKL